MKKTTVIGLICFFAVSIYAQTNGLVPTEEIIIGRNFKTDADIKAKECVFPDRIESWYIDDSTKTMTLQLRGISDYGNVKNDTGRVIQFDLLNKQITWNKKIDYVLSYIDQYDKVLIKTTDNKSSGLNFENGEDLWSAKNTIYYVNSKLRIGVGYVYSALSGFTNTLEGIDLNTVKSIWKSDIKREYNLNDFVQLNDSVILISADGLHTVNLKTGQGWNYATYTGSKDYTNTVVSNIFDITISVLLGSEYEITTGYDLISDIVSNVLVDSAGIYVADMGSIVRIDYNGNVLWKSVLPKRMVSKSSIFFKNNLIYLVNDGFATYNNETVSYGRPFIAAFTKNDGKEVFLNNLGYKKEQINAFEIQQDTIFLLSKKRIFKYSLKDGTELWEQIIKTDSLGELTGFAGSDLYIKSDSVSFKPILSDSTNIYVFTNKNKLLVFNNQLEFKSIIPDNEIFYSFLESNGYKFLEIGNSSIVIDKNNKLVAELEISGNALLRGTKLYEAQGNSFVEIEMDQLIKK